MAKRKAQPAAEGPLLGEAPNAPEGRSGTAAGQARSQASVAGSYTVLARRYRPQQFADIVGQEPVAQALINALESNRVAHAYLFTGARGVGKTSTARILAKALNCVKGPTANPCDQCDICQSIAVGEDVDVVEIDGASNRQIDDVRNIRQNVQFKPTRARCKIYIIDEVHMLTREAFNALLKTLEEPPPHVKFIFATTDVHKVPVTILSRCQRFDFVGIGTGPIVERLRQVVAAEGMQAEAEALELIARRAGGSMRDAQSLLDQLLAFGGQGLTTDQVHRLLGTAPDDRVVELAAAVLERDPKRALHFLDEAAGKGLQLGELLDQLIDYWRDLMVVRCAANEARDLSVPARHREALAGQAQGQSLDTILAGLDILARAKDRLRGSSHSRTWLELALVRLARLEDLVPLSQLAQSLARPGPAPLGRVPAGGNNPAGNPGTRSNPGIAPSPALGGGLPALGAGLLTPPLPSTEGLSQALPGLSNPPSGVTLTQDSLAEVWPLLLKQLPPSLETTLKPAAIAITGPNCLEIRFPVDYNPFYNRFRDSDGASKLAGVLRSATGQLWSVQLLGPAEGGEARSPGSPDLAGTSAARSRQQKEEDALKLDLVRQTREALQASFTQVDEGFGERSPPAEETEGEGMEKEEA